MTKAVRCAIYTRKSSEEGLEQSFNSLEAQREACVSYIQSQKHEGWVPIHERYDDGGFSGGNMERPALARILDDIRSGKIQVVVVYKVDRLTRSLSDFAKIIEVFDSQQVSFVSVTQQFNTTTSMGRLTLNVLLSFAQFERELTGERIRDKVAASKKKGMWMGGVVPLGYRCKDHRLLIHPGEAKRVREIFRRYLQLGSVGSLQKYLATHHIHSKVRTSSSGRTSGGVAYSRGALYQLLSNRIYIGKIVHRDQIYPGNHEPIIDQKSWDEVATQLRANNQGRRTTSARPSLALLTGLLKDTCGVRFTPTHSVKNGRRYRYYTSQAAIQNQANRPQIVRYPAKELETLVSTQIQQLLGSLGKYLTEDNKTPDNDRICRRSKDLAAALPAMPISKQHEIIRELTTAVIIGEKTLWIEVNKIKLVRALLGHVSPDNVRTSTEVDTIRLTVDFNAVRRRSELQILTPDSVSAKAAPDAVLIKTIARARRWYEQLISGEINSIEEIAERTRLKSRYIRQVLQCATLSPQITEAILAGSQNRQVIARHLLKRLPLDWQTQQKLFA